MDTIYINGTDVQTLGAKGLMEYTIGGTALDNEVFHGRYRTHFGVLASVPGTRSIKFTLAFEANTRQDALLNKSAVDALMVGVVDLQMPDELFYRCYSSGIGDLVLMGTDNGGYIGTAVYKFTGICHGSLVTQTGTSINCTSTMPRTDCKLECTVSADADEFVLGTVTFTNVSAGDVLVADGIEGRFLVNGAPSVNEVSFLTFPYLVPGTNTFPRSVTVTYEPTYI